MMYNYQYTFRELLAYIVSGFDSGEIDDYDDEATPDIFPSKLLGYQFGSTTLDEAYGSDYTDSSDPIYLSYSFFTYSSDDSEWLLTSYGYQILEMVCKRFMDSYCISFDLDPYTDDLDEELELRAKRFWDKFLNVLQNTYDKYVMLLDFYANNKANLMNQISSSNTSTSRFNDTPQNAETDDEFEADDHVTNINKVTATSTTDGDTVMARLKEIEDKYNTQLLRWSNEFKICFWED